MKRKLLFDRLDSTEFEEFCFELIEAIGFVNVDWRKGTGKKTSPADRGRDIECQQVVKDIDGATHLETWLIDCKHFKSGIPPKELQNLLTWAEAKSPNVALFIASNYLSNGAKDYLEEYRSNRRPPFKIKVWEAPQLQKLAAKKIGLLRKFNLVSDPIRNVNQLLKAEHELFEKIWYDRHQLLRQLKAEGKEKVDEEVWKGARRAAAKVEKKYGKKNLGPYDKFDWGMINGKLSALRWVLGDDWDMLDT